MSKTGKLSIIVLRIVFGWFFLYQGITTILDSSWSISHVIKNSRVFPAFYAFVLSPSVIPYISYITKGLYIAIGALLILGLFVRLSSFLGFFLMLFFYFPLLNFPYVTSTSGTYYIVDEHLIFAAVFFFLFMIRAGEYFGMGTLFKFSRY